MRPAYVPALTVLALLVGSPVRAASLEGRRPNIILILTDDQGYGDLSAHGNPVLETPNLDRLRGEAVRFTNFHVSPTCAPTRAALLTGRHEFKSGVTHTLEERERLALGAVTVADALKTAGYATGIFGKWHLGDEPEYWPSRRGFDEMFIHGGGGIGQQFAGSAGDVPGNSYFDPTILHNGRFVKTRGYCTDVFFARAMSWMASLKGRKPFFAFISLNAPHLPLQVRAEDEARYAGRVKDASTAKFFGMIANIDDNVGRLLSTLEDWKLEQDTLLVFMSDNGGTVGTSLYNSGMRGQKATPWVGGTRVPSFWRWPGQLRPSDVSALTAHIDFFPTLASIAGVRLQQNVQAQLEGRSLVPLLENPDASWPDRILVTHVGRWPKGTPPDEWKFKGVSILNSRWQLVSTNGGRAPNWQLFDLLVDPGETADVAAQNPNVVRDLAAHYDEWWKSVQPSLVNERVAGPTVNPFTMLYRDQLRSSPDGTLAPAPLGESP